MLVATNVYIVALLSSLLLLNCLSNLSSSRKLFEDLSNLILLSACAVSVLMFTQLYEALFTSVLLDSNYLNFSKPLGLNPLTEVTLLYYLPFMYIFILVTFITLVYCFTYNRSELSVFTSYSLFILLAGFGIFYVDSIILFFFLYESFLIPAFLILYSFAKTRKTVEAAYLMCFWTQFGAISLILNFQYLFFITESHLFTSMQYLTLSSFEITFLFTSLIIGFGVKLPIWPFYEWLPKAHVEASTNFSIFLSGVLVKFAFFGLIKYLSNLNIDLTPLWFYPFILIGFIDASSKVYYQTDLKKLIAYSTVIEMHWLTLAVISGNTFFWIAGFAMMIAHAVISSNFFLVIDSVTRRFKTRLLTEVFGLYYLTPSLYFVILTLLIVFLGFPGSLLFVAEFIFFTALLDLNFLVFILILFVAYFLVPSFFFKSWFLLLFGFGNLTLLKNNNANLPDLDTLELVLLWSSIIFIFWLGLSFQFFF